MSFIENLLGQRTSNALFQESPMSAVDLYAKFPFAEPPTFDDGYLHGEIVRHLMKAALYDDSRLKTSIIA